MKREPRWAEGSRAILIGVSKYDDANFPNIPGAHNSLNALRDLLTDPALCEWPTSRVTLIEDPESIADLGANIADLAEQVTGVLLLYYVGHGVLSSRGKLCLTVRSSRSDRPELSSLSWDALADILRGCQAKVRLVILDCCFAGQAIEALNSGAPQGLADVAHVDGVYTLTATMRNETAHVPPLSQQITECTSFTGELCKMIRVGLPGKPALLTLNEIFPALRQQLKSKGLPTPNQRGTGTAHLFQFSVNASSSHAIVDASGVRIVDNAATGDQQSVDLADGANNVRAAQLLKQALRAAQSVTDSIFESRQQAFAIASVAVAMSTLDSRRAELLFTDAERIARSREGYYKAESLLGVAKALRDVNPNRAALLIEEVKADAEKSPTLLPIVVDALGASSLENAADLIERAEPRRKTRSSVPSAADDREWDRKQEHYAIMWASVDPDRALAIAKNIHYEPGARDRVYRSVALNLSKCDPDRAELIAKRISSEIRADVLQSIAFTLIPTDTDRAERIVRSIDSRIKGWRMLFVRAMYLLAEALAEVDPDRAIELITEANQLFGQNFNKGSAARALAKLGAQLLASNPDRASTYLSDAEQFCRLNAEQESRLSYNSGQASSDMLKTVETVVKVDPDRAERIAKRIPDNVSRCYALVLVAKVLVSH